MPETRPFDEQQVRAEALAEHRLAIVRSTWPSPGELDDLAAAAARLSPGRWSRFHDGRGAQRAASLIDSVAAG